AVAQTMQLALQEARPIVLEPQMSVEVFVQNDATGEVIGDLNARQAQIQSIDPQGEKASIRAFVPLKQMFGYTTTLRSLTQGRGNFSMKFHAFGNAQDN
ncbi:MAG: elongation factor G, partial [Myxococcota bacterium]